MPRLPEHLYYPGDDTAPEWSLTRQTDFGALVLLPWFRHLHRRFEDYAGDPTSFESSIGFPLVPDQAVDLTAPGCYYSHEQAGLNAALQFAEHTLATTNEVYQEVFFSFCWRNLHAQAACLHYSLHFWLRLVFTPSRFYIFMGTDSPIVAVPSRHYVGCYQEEYSRLRFHEDAFYPTHNNAICSKPGLYILLMKNWLPPIR